MTADPYRTSLPPVPPRTVFVNPVAFEAIVGRIVNGKSSPVYAVEIGRMRTDRSVTVRTGPDPDGSWSIVSDPDCPPDHFWPEDPPSEVAAVVRQGIADAKHRSTP